MDGLFEGLAMWQLTAIFAVSASAVVGSGVLLARHGDAIADRTGLGGLFVGMLLLAGATSLPEIVTDVTAAAAGAPDLAIGDLFGSSMANMAILALIDLMHRGRVWPSTGLGHARLATVAMGLTTIVLLGVVTPVRIQVGWIGVESIVVVVGYILAARWIQSAPRDPVTGPPDGDDDVITPVGFERGGPRAPVRRHVLAFAGAAAVVLVSAPVMARSAQGIAEQTGVAETFVGVTLLALATSLPELVTSIAAVRIGAYDLAVGNLFGSNAINPTIVLFADLAYTPGPVLAAVSQQQIVAGLAAILLMSIAVGGIVHGARGRFERGEPDAILVLASYIVLLAVLAAAA